MEPQSIHYGEYVLRKHTCNVNPFKITTLFPYVLQSPADTPNIPKHISLCTYICDIISSGFLNLNKLEPHYIQLQSVSFPSGPPIPNLHSVILHCAVLMQVK